MIVANEPTIKGGSINPYGRLKVARAMEICQQNRLPIINLTESGGADLPHQAELFVPGGGHVPRADPALGGAHSRRSAWCSARRPRAVPTSPACPTTW